MAKWKLLLLKSMEYLVRLYNFAYAKSLFGPKSILSKQEKEILVKPREGFPRQKEDLQTSIKTLVDGKPRNNPLKDNMLGDGWYKFMFMLRERIRKAVTAASSIVSWVEAYFVC